MAVVKRVLILGLIWILQNIIDEKDTVMKSLRDLDFNIVSDRNIETTDMKSLRDLDFNFVSDRNIGTTDIKLSFFC